MSFLSRIFGKAEPVAERDPRDEANDAYKAALRDREDAIQRRDTRAQHHAENRLRAAQLERLRVGA